ncbi:MAG: FHA domain-containing protein [Myxococcota bacterium]
MLANITNLSSLIDEYAETKGFIERALEQNTTFSEDVIKKVVAELQEKISDITKQIEPLISDAQFFLSETQNEINEIDESKEIEETKLQELELKKTIGLMTEKSFEEESSHLRNNLEGINGQLDKLTSDKSDVEDILNRWQEISGFSIAFEEHTPEPEQIEEPEEIVELDPEDLVLDEPLYEVEVEEEAEEQVESQDALPSSQSDENSPFDTYEASQFDAEEIDFAMSEDNYQDPDFDILGDQNLEEDDFDIMGEQIDLDDGFEPLGDELPDLPSLDGPELTFDNEPEVEAEEAESEPSDNSVRTAILIRDAGTPDERTYPFTGEKYTIGRSQDNDIVIKGDSKVSRHHCKLFRRSSQFYIEDQHSSNGTVVNSELINERRLFGGEEIKVGETTFIFRIQ